MRCIDAFTCAIISFSSGGIGLYRVLAWLHVSAGCYGCPFASRVLQIVSSGTYAKCFLLTVRDRGPLNICSIGFCGVMRFGIVLLTVQGMIVLIARVIPFSLYMLLYDAGDTFEETQPLFKQLC